MFDKAKQLLKLRAEATRIQNELKQMEFESVELGGKVRVVVSGEQKVTKIDIDDSLLDPSEKDAVERFVSQAVNGAIKKSQTAAAEKMKALSGDLGLGL